MKKLETVTFGAGCFWSVEEAFRTLKGVVSTAVGYMGGTLKNPTYSAVCSDETGHVEVVKILLSTKDIDVNKANKDGQTPLMLACSNGH